MWSLIVSWIPACTAAFIHFYFVFVVAVSCCYTLYMLHGLFQDGAEYGRRVAFFSCVLLIILPFFVLDVYISYCLRQTHTFRNLNSGTLFTNTATEPFFWAARSRKCSRNRGKRAGVLIRLRRCAFWPPLPIYCWLTFIRWTTNSAN